MQKKLWAGRFDRATDPEVESFTASIGFDRRLLDCDIEGSLAHVAMLAACGIISAREARTLRAGLKKVREEIRSGRFKPSPLHEDIHMAVEARLGELVGSVSEKLHTARSRNDQVALDLRLFLRGRIEEITARMRDLQRSLVGVAEKNRSLMVPGFTHLQHAQPVLLAHHLLAHVEMIERDVGRMSACRERVNVMPLGAAALAGTSLEIDRKFVAERLGFRTVSSNSIDAVADRDFVIEFLAAAAVAGVHLSRMAEEIVLWASKEFSFIEIDMAYCTGSSLMPQKANPDVAELVRAKSGRLIGSLVAMLVVMKGLPLAYNRDMQEDKEPLFDASDTLARSLSIMARLWRHVRFRPAAVRQALRGDFSQATDLAEYLVSKGCPFREAHTLVGRLVARCLREGVALEDLSLDKLRAFSERFDAGACALLSHEATVKRKRSRGSTSPAGVRRARGMWKKKLGKKNA